MFSNTMSVTKPTSYCQSPRRFKPGTDVMNPF